MSDQGDLFGAPPNKKPTQQEVWLAFHRENPHVYRTLVTLAKQLHAAGHKIYSVSGIFDYLRFKRALKTTDVDFKLNDHYTAYYGRLVMLNEDDLDGFFKLRVQKSKHKEARDGVTDPADNDWRKDPFWIGLKIG